MLEELKKFINQINEFDSIKSSELIDYFSYYLTIVKQEDDFKGKDIDQCFILLAIPTYSNTNSYLFRNSQRALGKKQKFIKKTSGYTLTKYRIDEITQNLTIDSPKLLISKSLRDLLPKLSQSVENEFLGEAILTFEIGAYRASIIMVWLLTLDHLFEYILKNKLPEFITALRKKNITKSIHTKDDFGDLKESIFIEVCRGADIISNDVRKILETKLGIRNSYAHPSTVSLPKSKALEFIEDLVQNVILKY